MCQRRDDGHVRYIIRIVINGRCCSFRFSSVAIDASTTVRRNSFKNKHAIILIYVCCSNITILLLRGNENICIYHYCHIITFRFCGGLSRSFSTIPISILRTVFVPTPFRHGALQPSITRQPARFLCTHLSVCAPRGHF